MENFSDDEKFAVDQIVGQRKRKGVLEYLVQWKGDDKAENSWEPAKTIAADCAQIVQNFVQKQKQEQKSRSKSKSRSRSRSSSRSRKAAQAGKASRSRSRGRQEKQKSSPPTTPDENETSLRRSARQSQREAAEVVEEVEEKTVDKSLEKSGSATMAVSSSSSEEGSSQGRTLRSSTLEQTEKLEVQRVHNDQRPVREDDGQARSPIWRVADYVVILLFVVSVIAALVLFVEKFVDLSNFKKQVTPSFEVLKDRLIGGKHRLMELCQHLGDHVSEGWLYLVEQVKMPAKQAAGANK